MIVARGLGQNKHQPIVTGGYGLALLSEAEIPNFDSFDDDFAQMQEKRRIKDQNNMLLVFVTSAAAAGVLHG